MHDFDELCRAEHPRLVGALSLYLGDRGIAEELAQEALARALDRWVQVREARDPAAWVRRVAFNLARSWWRRQYAERRAYARHGIGEAGAQDPSPALGVAVRAAVAALPPRQREVVIARFYLDLDLASTAELLGLTVPAVKGLQHRAAAALRAALDDDPEPATALPVAPREVPDAH